MANFTFTDFTDFSPTITGPEQLELLQLIPVNVPYMLSEIFVAILAVVGNALTLFVFGTDRKLRRLTNYYIASLAMADLLVGVLGVPFAIMTSLGLPRPLWACLLMLSTLMILCTISIFCLVAVSVDRYWAILYPLVYSRVMTGKIARRIIFVCWCAGTIIGLLPVFGWHLDYEGLCFFVRIMDYDYLVFLYFLTIVGPGIIMAVFYAHIYSVVLKQLRQIAAQEVPQDSEKTVTPTTLKPPLSKLSSRQRFSIKLRNIGNLRESFRGIRGSLSKRKEEVDEQDMSGQASKSFSTLSSSMKAPHGSEYFRRDSGSSLVGPQLSRPSRREVKAAKNLSIIVLFFFICWFPLYTINCVQAFCNTCPVPAELMFFTIILSHANSAINPILYAYHMKDFRRGLEVHVLKRLGWRSSKSGYYGAPLSPHYSTIMQVNITPNSTLHRSHSPYLYNASSFDPSPSPLRALLYPMDLSPASGMCCSSILEGRTFSEQRNRESFLEFERSQKKPLNATSSWPPSLFSKMLLSPNLLSTESSSRSRSCRRRLKKFLSLDFEYHRRHEYSLSTSLVENHGSSSGTINNKLASLGSLDSLGLNKHQNDGQQPKRHRKSFSEPSSPTQSRLLLLSPFWDTPQFSPLSKANSSSISLNLSQVGDVTSFPTPTEMENNVLNLAAEKYRRKSSSAYGVENKPYSNVCLNLTLHKFDLKTAAGNKSNENLNNLLVCNSDHKFSKSANNLTSKKQSSQLYYNTDSSFKNIYLEKSNDSVNVLNNNSTYFELQRTLNNGNPTIPVSSMQSRKYSDIELKIAKHPASKRTLSDNT